MHPADRPNPVTTWLLALACMLVACVPANGMTLCWHGDHMHLGVTESDHGCPCDGHDHDHPIPEDHRDFELESWDGAPNSQDTNSVEIPSIAYSEQFESMRAFPPADRERPRNRGPTPPHTLRIVRTVVLLI